MLLQLLEVGVNPLWLLVLIATIATLLLRHRLYLYASAGTASEGTREHFCVIHNLEDVDLAVPLEVSVSTTNAAGTISKVRIFCGKQGPHAQSFETTGGSRWRLVVMGMAALDTWKVVCITNDEAERIRFIVRGWDISRNEPRSWRPTISATGVSITSRASALQREVTRPAGWAAGVSVFLMLSLYVTLVRFFADLKPETNRVVPLSMLSDYLKGLFPDLRLDLDGPIALGLIVIGILAAFAAQPRRGVPVPLGYLADPHFQNLLNPNKKSAAESNPGQQACAPVAGVDAASPGSAPPERKQNGETEDPKA